MTIRNCMSLLGSIIVNKNRGLLNGLFIFNHINAQYDSTNMRHFTFQYSMEPDTFTVSTNLHLQGYPDSKFLKSFKQLNSTITISMEKAKSSLSWEFSWSKIRGMLRGNCWRTTHFCKYFVSLLWWALPEAIQKRVADSSIQWNVTTLHTHFQFANH